MTDTHADSHELHHGNKHAYHLVDPSPWPIVGSIVAGCMALGAVLWFHGETPALLILGAVGVLAIMAIWWRDVIKEATFQGYHTPIVQLGMLK